MRLIDADVLLNELGDIWNIPKDWDGDIDETCETAFDVIENQPTVEAIPKEKLDEIVEKLEEEKIKYDTLQGTSRVFSKLIANKYWGMSIGYEEAIEIVKGVMNERD